MKKQVALMALMAMFVMALIGCSRAPSQPPPVVAEPVETEFEKFKKWHDELRKAEKKEESVKQEAFKAAKAELRSIVKEVLKEELAPVTQQVEENKKARKEAEQIKAAIDKTLGPIMEQLKMLNQRIDMLEKKSAPPPKNGKSAPPPPPKAPNGASAPSVPSQLTTMVQQLVAVVVTLDAFDERLQMEMKKLKGDMADPESNFRKLKKRVAGSAAKLEDEIVRDNAARVAKGLNPYHQGSVNAMRASDTALRIAVKKQEMNYEIRKDQIKKQQVINAQWKSNAQLQLKMYEQWLMQNQMQQGRMMQAAQPRPYP